MPPESHVLFVSRYFWPELIGSAPFSTDIAEWLTQHGRSITVVSGLPHYPDTEVFPAYRDGRRRREVVGGATVERLHVGAPGGGGARARILNKAEFLLRGLTALASGRVERHPMVLALCPSILSVALGVVARRKGGVCVAIVHDIQSGLAEKLGMVGGSAMTRLTRACERAVLNRTELVVVLSSEMKDQLRRIGVSVPIEVVPLWVDTDQIKVVAPVTRPAVKVLYSGNLGRKQGLGQVVALAEQLAASRPDIEIILRGNGSQGREIAAEIARRGLDNVRLTELQPNEALEAALAAGDIHLVPQNPEAAAFAVPSKVFNIMAVGRPFVATALPGSVLWELQRESGAFLCVPPDEPLTFAEAVLRLADDARLRQELGRRGREFVELNYAKPRILGEFMSRLDALAARSDDTARRRVLVVEPDAEGHSQEWLQHLIEFAAADETGPAISIAAPAVLCQALARSLPRCAARRVQLIALTPRETRLCMDRRLSLAAFARWWTMRRHLRQSGADSGFFLSLDLLALPLALGLGANGKKLSGILFRPSVHYPAFGSHNPSLGERLRDLRKALFYRLMLRNPALSRVLSLDPFFPAYAVQRYAHGHKVLALPDPAHPAVAAAAGHGNGLFPPGRIGFLLFGYLTERKGPLVVFEALELLPPVIAGRVAVLLAGRVDPAIRDRIEAGCRRLASTHPDLPLRVENRRLDQSELAALVLRSDVVLAPYQRFVGSSGVLLWAARAERPVLAQEYGLVGRLTREHRLGLAVDSSNSAALAAGIAQMVERGPQTFIDRSSARAFAASQTPDRFAAAVLADCMAKNAA